MALRARRFGEKPRKHPYSISPRALDHEALEKSSKIKPNLAMQVRVSSGMTQIDASLMKAVRGFWYV
ncbi:hypothetical protein A0U92_03535 [Acetobacter aceti]|uniref:Uncharacterized protein n=1 Tax=Acetobacter aceti TaxID=435 RepID=A0A1U9KDV9_ACEAC|nr:hypothetical protein [Acetobacter aceti]AQS83993.1 hypothetical protein A0U92_03535 [Acetobacter aceti]